MAAGDLTVTIVGNYRTLALAVAAMDAENLPATTDKLELITTGTGFSVIKIVRAAA